MHAPPISDKRHSRLFGRVTSWCSRQCACPDSIIPYHHYVSSWYMVCCNFQCRHLSGFLHDCC
ncbi:hypothetical protein AcV5_008349 [Taiwanofungus camphoratus]|nr:hypothetical protein AcV5_008349 [Antrodia cinnamomea]